MLKITNVSKRFKKHNVLENINAEFQYGKIYGIVGANGSGKSVLFKIICGFIQADSGTISIDGQTIGEDIDFLPDVGVLIEKPGFIEEYTCLQNLKYLASINKKIDERQIKEYLALVGLDANNKDKVKNYSLGMRQRLAIAQAIMENQKIIILDEPFNGLDKKGCGKIKEVILKMKQQGKLVLLTSHIEGDLEELSEQIFELSEGKLSVIEQK